jgi:hypothetical protein
MPDDDPRLQSLLDSVLALGIGLRVRRYEGDVADLVQEGRIDFAPAVAITIYFDGLREAYRDGLVACWEEFCHLFNGQLTWYADEDLGKWRAASPKRLLRPISRLRNPKAILFHAWTAVSGVQFADASPASFVAYVRDNGKNLSFVRATFPVSVAGSPEGAEQLLDRTRRWAEQLPCLHGYAGLTINQSPDDGDRQSNSTMLQQIAERFAGYEIDDCGGTVLVARDAIKGANWLTVLARSFVERLGGVGCLRSLFSPAIRLYELKSGGVILRAGPGPSQGDNAAGDLLSEYREVARALLPIRLTTHPNLGPAEYESFGQPGTDRWLRRLD